MMDVRGLPEDVPSDTPYREPPEIPLPRHTSTRYLLSVTEFHDMAVDSHLRITVCYQGLCGTIRTLKCGFVIP